MKIQNHITDILQLYEFSMAITKSLDYKETCNLLLKLLLKRKNLNAAWIIEKNNDKIISSYSIPKGNSILRQTTIEIEHFLDHIEDFTLVENNAVISQINPINVSNGYVAIFRLKEEGFLFLYSKKETIKINNLIQLQPVINKFAISLKACKAFKEQQQLLHNLEIRNQELSDYAHMVSHDLKSPLRSIDTLTAWLKEDYKEKLGDAGGESINLIRNNVEKMDTLITGILEYSTIGKNRMDVYNVDTNKLIDDIVELIEIPSCITVTKNNLPILKGDKYRLQQLFQNLIANAIAYNDKPFGTVDISVESKGDFWQFSIKDNGKGIDAVYFKKIFKTFEKLENNGKSTGIGLSIVKKIIDLYGGEIWLESQLEKGTTFFFTLKKEHNGAT
ncbi:ATP-binding protein [uncultured Winogradskyella sp.]|uniref:sensor histidine kinase n=1 Tax=uncultured Winogradskyella sp. TaxID=395353 RepID=UPI0030D86210|tara:strand:- start:3375 stop:4541 length:1167 start_codon:yes stop_codon:yes gene_type:complete